MSPTFPLEVIGARNPYRTVCAPVFTSMPREYILALKVAAGRDKDLADGVILLSSMKIRTREQAQQIVERYLFPDGLQKNAENIEHALRWLFEGKRGS